jgi:hypothetical protein
MGTSGK